MCRCRVISKHNYTSIDGMHLPFVSYITISEHISTNQPKHYYKNYFNNTTLLQYSVHIIISHHQNIYMYFSHYRITYLLIKMYISFMHHHHNTTIPMHLHITVILTNPNVYTNQNLHYAPSPQLNYWFMLPMHVHITVIKYKSKCTLCTITCT